MNLLGESSPCCSVAVQSKELQPCLPGAHSSTNRGQWHRPTLPGSDSTHGQRRGAPDQPSVGQGCSVTDGSPDHLFGWMAARNSQGITPQHHPHYAVASGWEIWHLRKELSKTVTRLKNEDLHFSVLTAFSSVKYRCKYRRGLRKAKMTRGCLHTIYISP